MILQLLPDSHEMLSRVMPEFDFSTGDSTHIETVLFEVIDFHDALGVAANQVGIEVRAFAMIYRGRKKIFFNPMVTWVSQESCNITEGCLTFGDMQLKISRPKECQISYADANGDRFVADLKGMECRAALHEIDHIDGVLFTSRVSKLRLDLAKKKISKKKSK